MIALLVVNLFATLLVYRGMELLVDRVRCEAPSASAKTGAVPAKRDEGAADKALSDPEEDRQASPQADAPLITSGIAPDDLDDIETIKARFATQYGDSAWAAQIQQTLQNVAGTAVEYAGITRDVVECKENICKLVLGYSDAAVFDAFVDDLTMALKGELSASLYFDTPNTLGGNSTVNVYLVRE
ncbi:MAG: hypothetical protein HY941_05315 [Gammaproteobacteria bacterium]|nr:hypothetical protein [Gammaproteobacteria bacterium]